MEIRIRKAGVDSLHQLLDWRREVIAAVFGEVPADELECIMEANREYYLREIPRGGHIPYFAYADELQVGCCAICLHSEMPSPENPTGRCAYLMNIFVLPEWRCRGVARRMVERMVADALAMGISKIYLETTDAARSLYSEEGFTPMQGMMQYAGK